MNVHLSLEIIFGGKQLLEERHCFALVSDIVLEVQSSEPTRNSGAPWIKASLVIPYFLLHLNNQKVGKRMGKDKHG